MNITFFSNVTSEKKAFAHIPQLCEHALRFFRLDEADMMMADATDTQILVADAMAVVGADIIDSMPNLALIQSEGVGYQGIDTAHASKKGIAVCNNKGVNDTAVAENTLLLMLSCLRSIISGNQSVYDGRQIDVKKASFGNIKELSQCTVGLVGFGDIARMTARFCNALGARVVYTNRTRYNNLESEYNVTYMDLDTLLSEADIVSLHLAVNDDTVGIADKSFFDKMKPTSYLINTARGDLVNNNDLLNALLSGQIAGAGLDVISPEPVTADNVLLDDRIKDKLVLTPHIAGITSLTVEKIFSSIYTNICRLISGDDLMNRVN